MVRFLINVVLLVALSALVAAASLAWRTPDLGHVQTKRPPKSTHPHDLVSMLQQTAVRPNAAAELDEGELNDHIANRLQASPKGIAARFADPDAVLLDLSPGVCRINVCWLVFGHRVVGAVDVAVQRTDKDFQVEIVRGAYGRLEVPRALLPPLLPVLKTLTRVAKPEIDALFKLPHIKIVQDKVLLDTKF